MKTLDISPFSGTAKLTEALEIPDTLIVLEDGQSVPEGGGCVRILHPDKGDERIVWMRDSLASIRDAKRMFVNLVKKGLTPFRVGTNGKRSSEVMREFDPLAEEVIFVPTPLVAAG